MSMCSGVSRSPSVTPPAVDFFEMQVTLTTLCKCLHASGQIPQEFFLKELHKVRFDMMLRTYPGPMTATFQRAVQSENILTQCVGYGGQALALELFQTCKVLSMGLKSNPQLLPGIFVNISQKMWEWHPVPGTLTLNPAPAKAAKDFTTLSQPAQAQHRDTLFRCGGGFGGTLRRMTSASFSFSKTRGKWESIAPMQKKREGHSAAVLGGKLYVCGGLNDEFAQDCSGEESVHGSVECYDPDVGWSQLPRLLTRRCYHSSCTYQGRLFVCGGKSPDKSGGEGLINTVESFQPSERRWLQMPSMQQERAHHVMTSSSERLFVYGGDGVGTLECFDHKNLWVQLPEYHLASLSFVALTACQGYLYILGRETASETEALAPAMLRFDPLSGAWKRMHLKCTGDLQVWRWNLERANQ